MIDEDRSSRGPGWVGTAVGLVAFALVAFAGEHPEPPRFMGESEVALTVVVEGNRRPLVGAVVLIEGPNRQGRTDAHGRATLRATAGRHPVRVEAVGFARDRRMLEIGRVTRIALSLDPEVVVEGSILDSTGAPLEGATVLATLDSDPTSPPYPAKVEPDGTFVLGGLPRERLVITADAPGHESESRLVDTRVVPVERQAFALATSGVLVVRVLDAAGGPARGASLEVAGSGTRGARAFTADADGVVRWEGVRTGEYEARARSEGFVSPHATGISVEAGRTTTTELRLAPSFTLDGLVSGTAGGVADAEIVVTDDVIDAMPRTLRAGVDGRFRLEGVLPGSTLYVTARAPGYLPYGPAPSTVARDALSVRLERAATIRGRVIDASGAPIVGAIVELVTARAPTPTRATVTRTGGDRTLELAPSGELGVTVGRVPPIPLLAIAGSQASVAPLLPSSAAALGSTATTTDPRGQFVLANVPSGIVQVAVQHPSHPTVLSEARRLAEGEILEGLVITLGESGGVEGRVVDARGFPVPSIAVELRAEGESVPRTTVTARDGSFTFGGLVGVAYVTALPGGMPGGRARIEVRGHEVVHAEIVLDDVSLSIEGRVVDERGFPIADAEVTVASLRARTPRTVVGVSESDGSFSIAGLPGPPYRIEARRAGFAPLEVSDVTRGDRVELVLVRGGIAEGRLLSLDDDAPVGDAVVRVLANGRIVRDASSVRSGRWRVADLAPGRYVARFESPTHLTVERAFAIEPVSRTRSEVDVGDVRLPRASTVRGTVVDAVGEPAVGATVRLSNVAESPRASVDRDGRYVLAGVPEGTHVVIAEHASAGVSRARGSVRVVGGEAIDDVDVRLPGRVVSEAATSVARARSGVAAHVDSTPDGLALTWIGRGSGAERAGLRVGDYVAAIDGERSLTASRANELLTGPVGVDVVLLVFRGGRETRVLVPRESYQR